MKSKATQARVSGTLFGKFFVDGQWKVIEKKCATCCYVQHFDKRPDEPSNMGCTKPGWEGYTHADEMACGGCFYFPNAALTGAESVPSNGVEIVKQEDKQ